MVKLEQEVKWVPYSLPDFKKIKEGDILYHIRGREKERMEAIVEARTNGRNESVVIKINSILKGGEFSDVKEDEVSIAFLGEIYRRLPSSS